MRVEIAGVALSVAPFGPAPRHGGEAVIFLHGAGMDHSAWALQAPLLGGRGHAVLVPDLPGHGASGGSPLPDIGSIAALVWRLADRLGLRRVGLVGHSMGALAALAAAARFPQRTERLALLGAAIALPVNAMLLDAADARPEEAIGMIAGWGLGRRAGLRGGNVPGASLDRVVRAMLAGSRPGVLHADLAACAAWRDGAAAAAAIACPTLVITGGEDRMAPARRGAELTAAIPGAVLEVVPSTGHMVMLEEPGLVADALTGFWSPRP